MSIWLVAVLRWILMAINSAEIILNLIYFIVYFGSHATYGTGATNLQGTNTGNSNVSDDNNGSAAGHATKSPHTPWLTILTQTAQKNAAVHNSAHKQDKKQSLDQPDANSDYGYHSGDVKSTDNSGQTQVVNGKTIRFSDTKAIINGNKVNNSLKRQPFYKTLPKTFARPSIGNNANKVSSFLPKTTIARGGSQESLKSSSTSSLSSASSSDALHPNGSSMLPMPPRRPPPPPPSSTSTGVDSAFTAQATNSPQTRQQLTISLSVSLFGFFTAQFRLSWLLLLYSLYLSTGIVIWLYSRVYVYRKSRHNNPVDHYNMIKSLNATPLTKSAPCQSSCVSSALAMLGQNQIDECHIQLMASRQDVLDVGMKILLSSSAFLLSSY